MPPKADPKAAKAAAKGKAAARRPSQAKVQKPGVYGSRFSSRFFCYHLAINLWKMDENGILFFDIEEHLVILNIHVCLPDFLFGCSLMVKTTWCYCYLNIIETRACLKHSQRNPNCRKVAAV